MMKTLKIVCLCLVVVVVTVVLCLLIAWPFMWMWNYAVVSAVTVTEPISYWVAFCLMMFISMFAVSSRTSSSGK